jgi:hypothetical protein
MTDNINTINIDADVPLAINIHRLKEIKAMEESEQRLIEDLFSIQSNITSPIPVNQKKLPLLNKKTIISKNPK